MLDQETKKRINDLRDILVGKVPDPKSQVEQIMIALIFKFMNDMDKESADLGGKASFFVGEFEKFSWSNMFDPRVSGDELVELYSDAIESMDDNPNIPQIFRGIFKNAFIPYKDPETLRLFLKQINEFKYSEDSEQLGDAFEHILNSLSSQGDAGQFRTPRHIIDFIVEIVDPKKDETVLDPASGTSGFLISAFKYIVNSNSEKSSGDLLSAAERKKIMENINGYDISPDMVRIGLANMYLHGFPEPSVFEYDALTSEDRWNEYFDVILANPPFMTPKGGIRPHNKFGLKSNRAEVLFVDYILTHLKPKGRAGIIVPEGIIFQSGKAYKELRKKLFENGLVGIISLPPGVFNPYSGVKTSIIIIDKSKKTDQVFFGDIQNDGYSLGANRNKIEGSELEEFLNDLKTLSSNSKLISFVEKEIIIENDLVMSGQVYKSNIELNNSETVTLEDCTISIKNGKNFNQSDEGKHAVSRIETISDRVINFEKVKYTDDEPLDESFLDKGDILFSHINSTAHIGKVAYFDSDKKLLHGINLLRIKADNKKVMPKFLYFVLNSKSFVDSIQGYVNKAVNQASINITNLKKIQIPLPPLEKQQEIVDEIEQYQKVIDGARQVVENYKPTIDIDPKWEIVELGEHIDVLDSKRKPITKKDRKPGPYPYYGATGIIDYVQDFIFDEEILLLGEDGAKWEAGEKSSFIVDGKSWVNNHAHVVKPKDSLKIVYLKEVLNYLDLSKYITGVTVPKLNQKNMLSIKIPLPPLDIQNSITQKCKETESIVDSNIRLIEIYSQNIHNKIHSIYKNKK